MAYSEAVITLNLKEFVKVSGLGQVPSIQRIEEAGKVATAALAQWPSQMVQTLPQIKVDWKDFSLPITKLSLYDVHLLVDQDPTMRTPVRSRHVRQQIEKTVELILPFLTQNKVQMYSCSNISSAGVPIRSVKDVSDAFGTFGFGTIGPQTLPIGRTLKERLLSLLPTSSSNFERPSLIYIFTTGVRADGGQSDLVQEVNGYKDVMKTRSLSPATVAFEIVQIGRNYPARQELGKLDVAYGPGQFLDICSETGLEDRFRQEKGWNPTNPAVLAMRNLVGALETAFIDSRTKLDDLSSYLAKNRVSGLEREVKDLKKKLANQPTKDPAVEGLKREVESLKRQIIEKDSKISSLQATANSIGQIQQSLNDTGRERDQLKSTVSGLNSQISTLEGEKNDLYRRLTTTHRYLMQWKSNANNATDIANGVGPLNRSHLFYGGITVNGSFKNSHGYGNYDHLIHGRERVEEPLVG